MEKDNGPKARMIGRMEEFYRGSENYWGIEPSAGVNDALPFLVPGRVLDLGSGDGRNTLFLAQQGFDVTAVDIMPLSIANLTRYAARSKVQGRVTGIVADLETYEIEGQFENVISTFTLHFLARDTFLPVLERIMEATVRGGVDVIEDFTQDGPMYKQDSPGYWLKSGELRRLYEGQGWQVLHYDERIVSAKATDEQGNPIQQGAATIVAAKPSSR